MLPETARQEGFRISKHFYEIFAKKRSERQTLMLPLLGVGFVLRLHNDAWSIVKRINQATNEPPPLCADLAVLASVQNGAICKKDKTQTWAAPNRLSRNSPTGEM